MRIFNRLVAGLTLSSTVFVAAAFGQVAVRHTTAPPGDSVFVKDAPQFTWILFWRQQDAATQQFSETLRAAAAKHPQRVAWKAINVKDATNGSVVAHYGVSRAPMPLAICVAENGAVTGVFTRRPTDEALERSLVTPAMATVTKALQDKKIVLVHVQRTPQTPLPGGAAAFAAEPEFQPRTTIVDVALDDPTESRFVADMQINSQSAGDSVLVVMAPPAVLVGKFDAAATKEDIAAKLHAAGKCCDDPNCKHNRKAN